MLKKFLEFILPDEGNIYFLTTINPHEPDRSKAVTNLRIGTVDVMVSTVARMQQYNVYFTPFCFKKRRIQEQALRCRCFFVDIDCGPGKAYSSKVAALQALKVFCRTTKFPHPNVVVDSGNGVHAYWVFEEQLDSAPWREQAERFKAHCIVNGLKIDASVSADQARIMRMPYTTNYKKDLPPKETKAFLLAPRFSLQDLLNKLPQITSPLTQLGPIPDYMRSEHMGVQSVSLGTLAAHEPAFMKPILRRCPLMAEVASSHGKSCREPLWRDTLNLLAYLEDGKDWAHAMSDGHHDYDRAATERKWQQRLKIRARGAGGPTLCTTFRASNTEMVDHCATCEHWGRVKTPIVLGRQEDVTTTPPYPFEFKGSAIVMVPPDGDPKEACRGIKSLQVEEYDGDQQTVLLVIEPFRGRRMTLRYSSMNDISKVRQELGTTVSLAKSQLPIFDRLMTSWTRALREAETGYQQLGSRIGWNDSWSMFVFGDRMVRRTESGAVVTVPLYGAGKIDRMKTAQTLVSAGSLGPWQQYIQELLRTGSDEFEVIIAQTFAASLTGIAFDQPAVTALVAEQSGIGKTTILKAADSAWFNGARGISMEDTPNYINNVIMTSNGVPVFWDELQLSEETQRRWLLDSIVNIMFRTLQGRDRGRMNANAEIRATATNKPFVGVGSNMPVGDMLVAHHTLAPEAMAARILQLRPTKKPSGRFLVNPLEHNYGLAGEAFITHLLRNYTKEKLIDVYGELIVKVYPLFGIPTTGQGRFWASNIALVLLAAQLVNESRLLKLNGTRIADAFGRAVQSTSLGASKAREQRDPLKVLQNILHDAILLDEVILTDTHPNKGKPTPAIVNDPRGRVTLWMSKTGWARIRQHTLEAMLSNKGQIAGQAIQQLRQHQVILPRRFVTLDPRVDSTASKGPSYDIDVQRLGNIIKQRTK